MTSGSLWNYYRDKVNDDANENIVAGNYRTNNKETTTSRSFEYNTKTIGKAPIYNNTLSFDNIITISTHQNGRPLEIEDKVNLTLDIDK